MEATERIGYSVGEKPTNPIIYEGDKWVYIISNVEEVQPPLMEGEQPDGLKHWRYVIEEVLPASEWQKRVEAERAEYESHTDDALIEIDMMVCDIADQLEALEGGAE